MYAICIESSHARGLGHLYRSLNLAECLTQCGQSCVFVINDHVPSIKLIRDRGFDVEVVDIHNYSSCWEIDIARAYSVSLWVNDRLDTQLVHAKRIRGLGIPLVTFDDHGEGASLANLHIAALSYSPDEILSGDKVLQGPEYIILNPEISKYRRQRDGTNYPVKTLVTLGGSDTYGATVKVVSLLIALGRPATIVIGPAFAHLETLKAVMSEHADLYMVKQNLPSLVQEMFSHDLVIAGGGITAFEAAASGLPSIVVANELFEIPVGKMLESLGCSRFAGHHEDINEQVLSAELNIAAMSRLGMANVGLEGGRQVAKAITNLCQKLS